MRVVEDHNEILYHAVETVSVYLRMSKGEVRRITLIVSY